MLASLQSWFPSLPLNIPNLRKATAGSSKFEWTDLLEEEYKAVKDIMVSHIRISPYNPEKSAVNNVDILTFDHSELQE